MDFDFPLMLVILTGVAGVVWLFDKLVLRRRAGGGASPWLVEFVAPFFPVLFAVLLLRSFLVEPFQIPSGSMIPTLRIGDFILVNKFAYGLRLPVSGDKILSIGEPERGDVMVFFPPQDKRYFIKRVVGLPGDEVRVIDNVLYVNGERMPQTPAPEVDPAETGFQVVMENLDGINHLVRKSEIPGRLGLNFQKVVPEGHYFMMGDNRDNSSDSRVWGAVPEANIVGKAFTVWMHWKTLLSWPDFSGFGRIR